MSFLVPDWDADSPELRADLTRVINEVARASGQREKPTLESARQWQRDIISGLAIPDSRYVGMFRGESGHENLQVRVGSNYGVPAAEVSGELTRFETKLQGLIAELDLLISTSQKPDADQLAAIVDLCAWVHAEWGAHSSLRKREWSYSSTLGK